MPLPRPIPRPPTLLGPGVPARSALPALAPQARPAVTRTEPVLRSDRASRQMSLPFFAPPAPPLRSR